MRANPQLHRITCAGIVDADHRETAEADALTRCGVDVLPVAEVENLVLLPDVSRAILEGEGYGGAELDRKLVELADAVFAEAGKPAVITDVALRFAKRRIDQALKRVGLKDASDLRTLEAEYTNQTDKLDIVAIYTMAEDAMLTATANRDLVMLLQIYDGKTTLVALAAKHLRGNKVTGFKEWLLRSLRAPKPAPFVAVLRSKMPQPIAA